MAASMALGRVLPTMAFISSFVMPAILLLISDTSSATSSFGIAFLKTRSGRGGGEEGSGWRERLGGSAWCVAAGRRTSFFEHLLLLRGTQLKREHLPQRGIVVEHAAICSGGGGRRQCQQ
jgi:hypothetical protein